MVEWVSSSNDSDASAKFRTLLATHSAGFWTGKGGQGWLLHRPGCSSLDFDENRDLAGHPGKCCADTIPELRTELMSKGFQLGRRCSRCPRQSH